MRAALYARFSSDLQHDRSIDDQLAVCRALAERHGLAVAEIFTDRARSGAHAASRPGLQALLAAVAGGRVELVLAEALDRLSRDQEDVAAIYKRVVFAGARILTAAEGDVDELHIGLKGTMNALFLKDLAAKIRRGQRGRVAAAKAPGGRAYGYRVVRRLDERGEPVRGERAIEPAEAAIVRRIFAEYAAGRSPRAIAAGLNADGIPSPTGRAWNASTINGNRQRRSGILYNEAYTGRVVWNRVHMVRDPDSGRRLSRPNDAAAIVAEAAPHLRIVDDATWQAAQARKAAAGDRPAHVARRPRRLLSGLIVCGCCGGGFTVVESNRWGCSGRRERGNCANARRIPVPLLEARVLAGIRDRLLAPHRAARYAAAFRRAVADARAEARRAEAADRRRLAALEAQIERLVDVLASGEDAGGAAIRRRLATLEAERAGLAARQAPDDGAEILELHPRLPEIWCGHVAALDPATASDPAAREAATAAVRALVERVTVTPAEGRGAYALELVARLPALAAMGEEGPGTVLTMVAEERYRRYHAPTVAIAV